MPDYELLNQKIKDKGIKLSFIGSVLGVAPNTLHRKLNGINEFKVSEINVLKDVLSLTPEEVNTIFFNQKSE